jgi:hypothetical protein
MDSLLFVMLALGAVLSGFFWVSFRNNLRDRYVSQDKTIEKKRMTVSYGLYFFLIALLTILFTLALSYGYGPF